jgi:predicted component of type VI protein secretion system
MARLLFRDAQGRDGGIELSVDPVYIGRAVDCAIRTDDAMVSRKHSLVLFESGRYWIEDLGSSNKTYVNDVPVKKQALSHNDVVRCGSLWLRFVEDAPRAAAPQGGPSTVAFRAAQPTATPEQVQQALGHGTPVTSPVGGGDPQAMADLAAQRDQALKQARWMREEVQRRIRGMVQELDKMRGELEELLRKLG